MNKKVAINLNDFKAARKFIDEVSKFDCDIDIIKDRYVVDAKSVIGIFTIDLSKPVDVEIHSDNEEEIKKFNEVMKEFLVDEE